jgi:hypothetical protein
MSEPTFDELLNIAERMAQDLQEYRDAAEKAGNPDSATDELLEEFHALWRRTNRNWQGDLDGVELPEGLQL